MLLLLCATAMYGQSRLVAVSVHDVRTSPLSRLNVYILYVLKLRHRKCKHKFHWMQFTHFLVRQVEI